MNKLNNIINLSKIFIIQNNNFNLINKEKNKINIRSPLLWAIIILFIGLSYISYEVINYLIKIGKPEIFLNGYFLFNAILIIMQTIILATNIFYYSKNMENILYMPFKPREILLAKFNTLVSIIYGTELIFALLPFIIYGIYTNMGILYFINSDLFIDIFGTSLLYRIDRIVNWSSSSGMQLTNSLTAIGSAGILGHGKTPIYFPEMQTDFIFSVFASNFGLIGASLLILLIMFFDITLIHMVSKTTDITDKYTIGGIIAVLLFQQIQNISMTIGVLPIMGITLPFISYGGSSLLSYMLLVGMIFNISNESLRFTN